MDITVTVSDGYLDPIRTSDLPVTGRDGHGRPTPTVRELAEILLALPGRCQDMPVTRYCDEGVAGINHALHYERESGRDPWTEHVALW